MDTYTKYRASQGPQQQPRSHRPARTLPEGPEFGQRHLCGETQGPSRVLAAFLVPATFCGSAAQPPVLGVRGGGIKAGRNPPSSNSGTQTTGHSEH